MCGTVMAANIRNFQSLINERTSDEGGPTVTSNEQTSVEETVSVLFSIFSQRAELDPEAPELLRQRHVTFLKNGLTHLMSSYECLDASRPWLCYWILHALDLLEESISTEDVSHIAQFLGRCQNEDGGFGGGPGQYPHLASTYAAVSALCVLGTKEAYRIINRETLQRFLWRLRTPEGAFRMHTGGEVDIRGIYCALAVATLTHVATDALFDMTPEWIASCQTYEGGFSGVPGMEAHGGYSFCGLASLILLGKERLCDTKALLRWAVKRQMRFEGGFQGRTNKLVDSCYSFWQGGLFPLLHRTFAREGTNFVNGGHWLFHQEALQEYILICCQLSTGGLIDKPGKRRDFYHTCYALSGLSIAQHSPSWAKSIVLGNPHNELAPLHPVYNIGIESLLNAMRYFRELPVPQSQREYPS